MWTCARRAPAGWFVTQGTATARVGVAYDGAPDVVSDLVGTVPLIPAPAHSSLTSSGMTLTLPSSPRFPEDMFDAVLTASLVEASYGLRAWSLAMTWSSSALFYTSHSIDGVWGEAEVAQGASSLQVLVNSPALDDVANPLVMGADIPILRVRIQIASGTASGAYPLSVTVASMINFGTKTFLEDTPALALDGRVGSSNAGRVVVEAPVNVGMFLHTPGGIIHMTNTAPITGRNVSIGAIDAFDISSRPEQDFVSASVTCSSPSSAVVLIGCTLSLPVAAEAGGDVLVLVDSVTGGSASAMLVVWHPGIMVLEVDDPVLGLIDGCADTYQWTRLRLRANGLDVTPLLTEGTLGSSGAAEVDAGAVCQSGGEPTQANRHHGRRDGSARERRQSRRTAQGDGAESETVSLHVCQRP